MITTWDDDTLLHICTVWLWISADSTLTLASWIILMCGIFLHSRCKYEWNKWNRHRIKVYLCRSFLPFPNTPAHRSMLPHVVFRLCLTTRIMISYHMHDEFFRMWKPASRESLGITLKTVCQTNAINSSDHLITEGDKSAINRKDELSTQKKTSWLTNVGECWVKHQNEFIRQPSGSKFVDDDTPQCVSCSPPSLSLRISHRCKQFFAYFLRHQKVHRIIIKKANLKFLSSLSAPTKQKQKVERRRSDIGNIFIQKCWCRRNSIRHYFITERERRCRHLQHSCKPSDESASLSWKSKFMSQRSTQCFLRIAITGARSDENENEYITYGESWDRRDFACWLW